MSNIKNGYIPEVGMQINSPSSPSISPRVPLSPPKIANSPYLIKISDVKPITASVNKYIPKDPLFEKYTKRLNLTPNQKEDLYKIFLELRKNKESFSNEFKVNVIYYLNDKGLDLDQLYDYMTYD